MIKYFPLTMLFSTGITKFNSKSAGYCMGSASGSLQSYTAVLNSAHEANQTLAVSSYFYINTFLIHWLWNKYYWFRRRKWQSIWFHWFTILFIHFSYLFLFYAQNSIKSLGQLEQCVDLTALDTQFQRACCGQNDYIQLYNGFSGSSMVGGSSGYDWIDAACTASTYNVSTFSSFLFYFHVSVTGNPFTSNRNSFLLHCVFPPSTIHPFTPYIQCPMQPAATSSLTTSPYLPPGYYTSQAACTTENLLYADAATGRIYICFL